jgi:glycerol-3-phosphate acyltransferase PlsY
VFHWRDWPDLWPMLVFGLAMSALIIVRHRANIVRLIKGEENKIKSRRERS